MSRVVKSLKIREKFRGLLAQQGLSGLDINKTPESQIDSLKNTYPKARAPSTRAKSPPRQLLTVDGSGRINLGGDKKGFRYEIEVNQKGDIHLIHVVTIPASEAWFFQNKSRVASMDRSMSEAKSGKIKAMSIDEIIDL